MERTFVMIKPDAIRRKLIGEVIRRIEQRNLEIVHMRMLRPSRELAEKHYEVHRGKEFYDPLVDFVTSGPVVAIVVEGEQCVSIVRRMMGALDPEESMPGTIRGDFTISTRENLIHGSDSPETAAAEIALWFPESA